MELPRAPRLLLLLRLLLCLLPLSQTETYTDTPAPTASAADDLNVSSASASPEPQNTTLADCLVDNQSGLIALGSAGGLIACLLVAVVTLACQVHHLQRRVYVPRSSRSNPDLAGSAGYWAGAAAALEREGAVAGPCDDGVMLQEVTTQEELGQIREEEEDEEGAAGVGLSPEEKPLMQSSESRESCSDLPRDLEDMPLVV